jgi:hypothetical protein
VIRGYLPNGDFEAEWLASDDALELVLNIADAAVPVAQALAPKREEHLANSIEATAGFVDGVATGRLLAKDFKAHWWENGTSRHAAQPYLRPAMEQVTGSPIT